MASIWNNNQIIFGRRIFCDSFDVCRVVLGGNQAKNTFRGLDVSVQVEVNTTSGKKSKEWAVVLIGGVRTYAFVRDSFLQHVVNAVDPGMDVAAYTFYDQNCAVEAFSMNNLARDCVFIHIDNTTGGPGRSRNNKIRQTLDRFRQQREAFNMLATFAKRKGLSYKYIVLTRPDLLYSQTLNTTAIEAELTKRPKNTVMIPTCCDFEGYCDRFVVGTWQSMFQMVGKVITTGMKQLGVVRSLGSTQEHIGSAVSKVAQCTTISHGLI